MLGSSIAAAFSKLQSPLNYHFATHNLHHAEGYSLITNNDMLYGGTLRRRRVV